MSAGTAFNDTASDAGCPAGAGCKFTPGPVGWLKKTKSASERTLPRSVTNSADRSAGVVSWTEITTSLVASGPFWPLASVADKFDPSLVGAYA